MNNFAQQLKAEMHNKVKEAEDKAGMKVKRMFIGASRGPVTTSMMRTKAYGPHPFAIRRWAAPLIPAEIINRQTGEFMSSWRSARIGDAVFVWNDSPHGKYLESGTSIMFERPVVESRSAKIEEIIEKELDKINL